MKANARAGPTAFSMTSIETREGTLHAKLDPAFHWAAVKSIFWVGGKLIMKISAGRHKHLVAQTVVLMGLLFCMWGTDGSERYSAKQLL
jgi:hypothetical protein